MAAVSLKKNQNCARIYYTELVAAATEFAEANACIQRLKLEPEDVEEIVQETIKNNYSTALDCRQGSPSFAFREL